jgi:hypothetical protein
MSNNQARESNALAEPHAITKEMKIWPLLLRVP